MNASKFMDKQIMDLSRSKTSSSKSNDDYLDLMNPIPANDDDNSNNNVEKAAESAGVTKKEEILPNYDFQPIRPAGVPSRSSDTPPMGGGSGGSGAVFNWNGADSNSDSSPTRSYGYLGSVEPDKVVLEKAHSVSDAAIVSEIDRTMKRYTDNLLHAIDGLSARLSQLESRTRQLEHSVDDLKVSIGNNHGGTDGKMRQMENILRELQSCMVDLKDKQDVMNARIQLEKLQISEVDQTPETRNTAHMSLPQQPTPAPQQSNQQFPVASMQSLPPGVSPNAPPPPQQSINPPMQLPTQYPPTPMPAVPQRDTYFPPPGQTQEPPSQQYPAPPPQLQQPQTLPPPPGVQHHQYQPSPPTPYPHGPHLPQQYQQQIPAINNPQPPQLQLPMAHAHHSEETYPPSLRQPPSQPTSGPPPSQQFYGTPPSSHMYDSPTGRSGSGFSSSAYNPPNGPSEPFPYSGSSSHYGTNPGTKLPSHSSGSGGANYPQLPTARVLPQAIPTAAAVSGGASSGGSGNRVPIDDVIDKVTTMGFSREQVKATVRRLTENGQPVDLNVVLDKLMNDGNVQPPRGWFGR